MHTIEIRFIIGPGNRLQAGVCNFRPVNVFQAGALKGLINVTGEKTSRCCYRKESKTDVRCLRLNIFG